MAGADRTAVNIAFTFAARAAELLTGLLLIALLSRALGLEDFGRYSVLTAVGLVALPLLNLGFPRILVREIAARPASAAEQVLLGWSWNLLTALLLLGGLLLASRCGLEAAGPLLAVGLTAGFTAMSQTAGAVGIALQRMRCEALTALTASAILLVLTAAAVWRQLGLGGALAAQTLAALAGLTAAVLLTSRLSPYLRELRRAVPSLLHSRAMLTESAQIGLFQLLVQLHLYTGVFFLQAMAGNAEAALFQAPFRIFTRVQIIPMTFLPVLLPIFSRLFFAGKNEELRETAGRAFRWLLLGSQLLTFFAAALADQLMPLLLGAEFKDSAQVFSILALSICFSFLNTAFDALFIAAKKVSVSVWIQAAGVLLCALANLLLIPRLAAAGGGWAVVLSSGCMFAANCWLFRHVLPGLLAKTLLAVGAGWTAGWLAAAQAQEFGIVPPLLLGVLACAGCGFLLRLISLEDVSKLRLNLLTD
ncbi:MAG: oligosaccharide flippase family protein [Candidatus Electronema sp. VV]